MNIKTTLIAYAVIFGIVGIARLIVDIAWYTYSDEKKPLKFTLLMLLSACLAGVIGVGLR